MAFGMYSVRLKTKRCENMDEKAYLDGLFYVRSIDLLTKYNF